MNQLNSLILEGNLVKDAVLTEPAPGFKKCVFTMGVNRFYKNRNNESVNEASFFDVEAYNQVAEWWVFPWLAQIADMGGGFCIFRYYFHSSEFIDLIAPFRPLSVHFFVRFGMALPAQSL